MDYNSIGSFLDKFKKIIFQKEELKNIVVKTIEDEINHRVDSTSVKLKNGFIYINSSPILRSEIMIHKNQILINLKKISPDNIFLDIK